MSRAEEALALFPEPRSRAMSSNSARAAMCFSTDVKRLDDLGLHFGADLYQREVDFLLGTEWAETAEDIVWRRSKLGLRLSVKRSSVWISILGWRPRSANSWRAMAPNLLDHDRQTRE